MNYTVSTYCYPSSAYTMYLADIVDGIPFNTDYIGFMPTVSGDRCVLITGDITQSGSSYIVSGGSTVYTIYLDGNGYRMVTGLDSSSITIDNSAGWMIYSSVGLNPRLEERSVQYVKACAFVLCVAFLLLLILRIFRHVS